MITAFALALAQLTDRRILAVLLKSAGLTVIAVGLLGWGLWAGSASLLTDFGLDAMLDDGGAVRGFLSFVAAVCFIAIWAMTGPLFDFGEIWKFTLVAVTSIVTFLMVFLIQNTQGRTQSVARRD